MKETTICIIGAGPGGIATALALAKKGIGCVLVDKATFPRDKVDADVMPGMILRALNAIDPKYVTLVQQATCLAPLKGTIIFAPNGKKMKIDYRLINVGNFKNIVSCYMGTRYEFDDFLLNEIRQEPLIELIEAQAIHDFERREDGIILFDKNRQFEIKAEMIVIANGANSRLARKIGNLHVEDAHHGVGVRAYFKGVHHTENTIGYNEMYLIDGFLPGILYITALPNGLTNVNLGTRADIVKKKQLHLKKLVLDYVHQVPEVKERFKNSELVGKVRGHSLPFGTKKRKLAGERYLIVGDAGAMIDLTSGNGIGNAMWSGVLAADQIEKSLTTNNFSESFMMGYDQAIDQKLANNLKLGKMIAPWMGRTRLYGFYKWCMNVLIGFSGNSKMVTRLLYEPDLDKKMKKPSFYFKLLFGS